MGFQLLGRREMVILCPLGILHVGFALLGDLIVRGAARRHLRVVLHGKLRNHHSPPTLSLPLSSSLFTSSSFSFQKGGSTSSSSSFLNSFSSSASFGTAVGCVVVKLIL